jgi:hypothetical protein
MSNALLELPSKPELSVEPTEVRGKLRELVQFALCSRSLQRPPSERRREQRHAYPYPISLTPLDHNGDALSDATIAVVGKHLSESGVDFYSQQPIEHRKMIASLSCGQRRWVGLLLDLTWCRFNHHGWYENGGRFLRIASSPFEHVAGV